MEHRYINILNYGACADGKTDCTIPVRNALEDIRKLKEPVTLLFPKGEYHFYKENAEKRLYHTSNTNSIDYPIKEIGILIEEQENLRIDGEGSLFIFHGNMMALAIVKSRNIKLCNFSWDFPCAPVSEMTIEKIEENKVIYKIVQAQTYEVKNHNICWYEKSPLTGEIYWSFMNQEQVSALVVYQPWNKIALRYPEETWPFTNIEALEQLEGHRIQATYKNIVSSCYKEGMCFEICRNAYRETAGAFIWESQNVTVEEVNVHYLHGFGWLVQMSQDISYKKCKFMPREGTGRKTTGFADLIHVSGASGEIKIEDCQFSNAHDDPINIHGTFTRVRTMVDDHTMLLEYVHPQQGGFRQYYPGNKIIFYARDTLQGVNEEQEYTVARADEALLEDGRCMQVTFVEELPKYLGDCIGSEGKYVAENVTYTPSVIIKNCYFATIPTRGILCTSRKKVMIEHNEFHGISMEAIYISNDSNEWYESGPVREMEICNNSFYILKTNDEAMEGKEAINIHPIIKGEKLPDERYPIHKNIRIHHNDFYLQHDKVISAENTENLSFYSNRFFWIGEVYGEKRLSISFKACKNVEIYNNEYEGELLSIHSKIEEMPE